VITGASSGLGRATAVRFAAQRCRLVLAARREDALRETATLCENAGGSARVVVTDVTREEDVERLAQAAMAEFGRIDIWVNNAGVTLFGPLEGTPFEAHRRVIETNLFGAMYGARAVVPIFRQQASGVLINVGSTLSKIGQPFVPSYVISKFALRGLSEALRSELADLADVHVCTIYPYAMNTQHFQSGANLVGIEARAMPPAQAPGKAAQAIVELARRPRRELHLPRSAVLGLALHALFPRTVERMVFHALANFHFGSRSQPSTNGNLYMPAPDRPKVHGHTPPVVPTSRFFYWLFRNLIPIASGAPRVGHEGIAADTRPGEVLPQPGTPQFSG
jgi:short-subunit dehydrogenase